MREHKITEFIDSNITDEDGGITAMDYHGDRMFTTSLWTNSAGMRVTTLYCGRISSSALVFRRAYGENKETLRTESVLPGNPMVLQLEVKGQKDLETMYRGTITQGESRRYFQKYIKEEGLRARTSKPYEYQEDKDVDEGQISIFCK